MTTITKDDQNEIAAAYERRQRRELVVQLQETMTEIQRGLEYLAQTKDDQEFDDGFAELHAAIKLVGETVDNISKPKNDDPPLFPPAA